MSTNCGLQGLCFPMRKNTAQDGAKARFGVSVCCLVYSPLGWVQRKEVMAMRLDGTERKG